MKNNVFEMYNHEAYKFGMVDKEDILEKRWSLYKHY